MITMVRVVIRDGYVHLFHSKKYLKSFGLATPENIAEAEKEKKRLQSMVKEAKAYNRQIRYEEELHNVLKNVGYKRVSKKRAKEVREKQKKKQDYEYLLSGIKSKDDKD